MRTSQRTPRSTRLRLRLAAAAAITGIAATACAGGDAGGAGTQRGETVELTVGLFGDFVYHELYEKFEKKHPNVRITENVAELADHHDQLATHLATGSGAPDVAAIEEAYIAQFKAQPQNFVNLLDFGAGKLEEQELDWAWQMSVSPNGAQIGLRTDVGGLAMCYRVDLFRQAGLPVDRDKVSELWSNWEGYIDVGKRFMAQAPPDTYWFDSAGQIFNAITAQADTGYYTRQDEVVVASNPAVKEAFELATSGVRRASPPRWRPSRRNGTPACSRLPSRRCRVPRG